MAFVALHAFGSTANAADRAEIMLMPTRVALAQNERSATVQLKNTGTATGAFSVKLVDMTMNEDGTVTPVKDGEVEPFSAIPYLHVSPKSVTVKPGEVQAIRLLQKRNVSLEPGEYRAHLRVKMENDNVEGTRVSTSDQTENTTISIKANLVLIIPVIFRVGETDYKVSIEEPRLVRTSAGQTKLDLTLVREGNRSSMGDFSVSYKKPGEELKLLTFYPGIPVYRPTPSRHVSIPLDIPEGVSLSEGTLEITYTAQEQEGGDILAQTSLPLN